MLNTPHTGESSLERKDVQIQQPKTDVLAPDWKPYETQKAITDALLNEAQVPSPTQPNTVEKNVHQISAEPKTAELGSQTQEHSAPRSKWAAYQEAMKAVEIGIDPMPWQAAENKKSERKGYKAFKAELEEVNKILAETESAQKGNEVKAEIAQETLKPKLSLSERLSKAWSEGKSKVTETMKSLKDRLFSNKQTSQPAKESSKLSPNTGDQGLNDPFFKGGKDNNNNNNEGKNNDDGNNGDNGDNKKGKKRWGIFGAAMLAAAGILGYAGYKTYEQDEPQASVAASASASSSAAPKPSASEKISDTVAPSRPPVTVAPQIENIINLDEPTPSSAAKKDAPVASKAKVARTKARPYSPVESSSKTKVVDARNANDALYDVAQAEYDLAKAKLSGDKDKIAEASKELARAQRVATRFKNVPAPQLDQIDLSDTGSQTAEVLQNVGLPENMMGGTAEGSKSQPEGQVAASADQSEKKELTQDELAQRDVVSRKNALGARLNDLRIIVSEIRAQRKTYGLPAPSHTDKFDDRIENLSASVAKATHSSDLDSCNEQLRILDGNIKGDFDYLQEQLIPSVDGKNRETARNLLEKIGRHEISNEDYLWLVRTTYGKARPEVKSNPKQHAAFLQQERKKLGRLADKYTTVAKTPVVQNPEWAMPGTN